MRLGAAAVLAASACALVSLLPAASGAVIGIDLGGEFLKASLVKPRVPLDIVLNPEGRRRSEAVVGFFDGEQAYGGAALNQVRLRRTAASLSAWQWRVLVLLVLLPLLPLLPPPLLLLLLRHGQPHTLLLTPAVFATPWRSKHGARRTSWRTSRCWWVRAWTRATCSG